MSISDRLDQIETAAQACIEDRPADPNAVELAMKVPALTAAVRAVLDRHPMGRAAVIEGMGRRTVEHCLGCRGAHRIAHDEHGLVPWPCPTVRAVTTALGEDTL